MTYNFQPPASAGLGRQLTRPRTPYAPMRAPGGPAPTHSPETNAGVYTPDARRPQWETSPLGHVKEFDYTHGQWDTIGNTYDLERRRMDDAMYYDQPRRNALKALQRQITTGPGGAVARVPPITAEQSGSNEPYDRAAEAAIYGRGKERTGQAMQAALRGLSSQMAARGITGSGIEGDKIAEVFSAGLGELGDLDTQLAHEAAGRAFEGEQLNVDRRNTTNQFNAELERWYQQAQADQQRQRLSMLAQLTSLY